MSDLLNIGTITPDRSYRIPHDNPHSTRRLLDVRFRAGKSRERAAHRSGIDLFEIDPRMDLASVAADRRSDREQREEQLRANKNNRVGPI